MLAQIARVDTTVAAKAVDTISHHRIRGQPCPRRLLQTSTVMAWSLVRSFQLILGGPRI